MGAGKIKFEHLRETKDLAATPTESKDGNIAFLKPTRKPGPAALRRPKGRIDRSFSTPFNSSRRIRLAGGRPGHRQDHAAPRLCLKCKFALRTILWDFRRKTSQTSWHLSDYVRGNTHGLRGLVFYWSSHAPLAPIRGRLVRRESDTRFSLDRLGIAGSLRDAAGYLPAVCQRGEFHRQ
jgi:hypothetical protein